MKIMIMGITSQQQKILNMIIDGKSYKDISVAMGSSVDDVMFKEMEAMSKISERYNVSEIKSLKIIKSMLLILLSIIPFFSGQEVERSFRSQRARIEYLHEVL